MHLGPAARLAIVQDLGQEVPGLPFPIQPAIAVQVRPTPYDLIAPKVFIKSFCRSHLPRKSVNISFNGEAPGLPFPIQPAVAVQVHLAQSVTIAC